MSHPRVVLLLPAWQAAGFIGDTLDSIARQTWPGLEVLISVDRSDDATAEVCQAFARAHPNARAIVQTERLGWTGNTNALLAAAEGDYLLILAHDDRLDPAYVETLVAALDADPAAVIAFCDMQTTHPDGRVEACVYDRLDEVGSPVERARRLLRGDGPWWTAYRGVFRAEAARRIGGLRRHAAGEFAADWPWLVGLGLLGGFRRVPGVLYWKAYQPASLSYQWRYGLGGWFAVSASCLRQVMAADLPFAAKLGLAATVWGKRLAWVAAALRRRLTPAAGR
jgi:glycosyltransferase involved in cell wall biosynthesis